MQIIKKISYVGIIFGFFLSSSLQSEISYLEIKGLHRVIKPEKSYLSPLNGFMWWQSKQIEKLYRYGGDSDTTIQLIKKLFYLQPDNVSFDCVKTNREIATFFTAKVIGMMMNALEEDNGKEEVSSMESSKKGKDYEGAKKALKEALTKELGDALQKVKKGLKLSNPQVVALINQIDPLVELIFDAYQESLPGDRQKYVPYTVQNIFLGFLWRKASSKQAFLDYFTSDMLIDPAILQKDSAAQKVWLAEKYDKQSIEKVKSFFEIISLPLSPEKFEEVVFNVYSYNFLTALFPPQSAQGNPNPIYKGIPFPDCGETSLRNFFNNILYDKERGIFDVSILERAFGKENIYSKLKEFYESPFSSIDTINSASTHDKWAEVVSELPGVFYGNKTCDIHPGIDNMLKAIKQLIGVNTFQELVDKLKGAGVTITMDDQSKDNLGNVDFTIEGKGSFVWHFEEGHFFITVEPIAKSIEGAGNFMSTLDQQLSDPKELLKNNEILNLILFFKDKKNIEKSLIDTLEKRQFPACYILHAYLALYGLQDNDEKLKFIDAILKNKVLGVLPSNFLLVQIIKKVIDSLPSDDYYKKEITQILLSNSSALEKSKELQNICIKAAQSITNDYRKIDVIKVLLKSGKLFEKIPELKNLVASIAQSISGDYRKIDVIKALLESGELLEKTPELKKTIASIALTITDDFKKIDVIKALLESGELLEKIPELKNLVVSIAQSITNDYRKMNVIKILLESGGLLEKTPELKKTIASIALTITDDFKKIDVIKVLLKSGELFEKIPELKNLVGSIAQLITDYQKVDVIKILLESGELLEKIPELKKTIASIAQSITNDHRKIDAIKALLESGELFEKIPESKNLIVSLVKSIDISKMYDTSKIYVIKGLLELGELLEKIPELKNLVVSTVQSITDDNEKVNVIKVLLELGELLEKILELKNLIVSLVKSIDISKMYGNSKVDAIEALLKSGELLKKIPELKNLVVSIAQSIYGKEGIEKSITMLQDYEKKYPNQIPEFKGLIDTLNKRKNDK